MKDRSSNCIDQYLVDDNNNQKRTVDTAQVYKTSEHIEIKDESQSDLHNNSIQRPANMGIAVYSKDNFTEEHHISRNEIKQNVSQQQNNTID